MREILERAEERLREERRRLNHNVDVLPEGVYMEDAVRLKVIEQTIEALRFIFEIDKNGDKSD